MAVEVALNEADVLGIRLEPTGAWCDRDRLGTARSSRSPEGDTNVAYCIEGTVTFEDLEVLRADATPQPLEEFIAEGHRYWEALHSCDARLSVEAQQAAQDGTPSWRRYVRNTATISGSGSPGTG